MNEGGIKLYVYVLILKAVDGFYVGTSRNLRYRIKDHCEGNGSVITKAYGVKGVLSITKVRGFKELERLEAETVREMKRLGHRCWGAGWNNPQAT